jgi:hypothetical protein
MFGINAVEKIKPNIKSQILFFLKSCPLRDNDMKHDRVTETKPII